MNNLNPFTNNEPAQIIIDTPPITKEYFVETEPRDLGEPARVVDDWVIIRFFDDRIEYHDDNGLRHNLNGPAVIYHNGDQEWHIHGVLHRIGGPAMTFVNDDEYHYEEMYYQNGKLHNEDGPAITYTDGHEQYFLHGKYVTQNEHARLTVK